MKKMLFVVASFFLVSSLGFSQTKGTILLGSTTAIGGGLIEENIPPGGASNGGGIGFFKTKSKSNGQTEDETDLSFFNLAPRVGYFFTDDFVGGVKVDIRSIKNKYDEDSSNKTFGLAAGPFLRYYFNLGNARPFIEAEAVFGTYKDTFESSFGEDDDKLNSFRFSAGGGVAVFLNDFISFDVLAGYQRSQFKYPDDDDETFIISGFGLGLGLSVFLGQGGE